MASIMTVTSRQSYTTNVIIAVLSYIRKENYVVKGFKFIYEA